MAFKGVTVLDIGSSAVTVIVGDRGVNNTFLIKGQASRAYDGFAEGQFYDEQKLADAIIGALQEVKNICKIETAEIYVSVPGVFIDIENRKYKITFDSPKKVKQKDVDYLFELGREKVEREGYEVIDQGEVYFALDDGRKVQYPVGIVSSLIGGAITYFLCEKYFTDLMRKILKLAKIKSVNFVYVGQAQATSLISREERENFCLIVDVGYITSEVSLHLGNGVLAEFSEDFGGGHVMTSIMRDIGLPKDDPESWRVAEMLKREVKFGYITSDRSVYTVETETGIMKFSCDQVNDIVSTAINPFWESVKQFIEESVPQNSLDLLKIYLTGGGLALMKGIKLHILDLIKMPIEILSPSIPLHNRADESSSFALLGYALDKNAKKRRFW